MKVNNVVIVGAGFGGLEAAKGFKNFNVNLTVIDRSNHHLFQPLLYQVATAGLSPADIAAPIRSILRNQKNTEVIMDEVIGVDLLNQKVTLRSQNLPFDFLIIATGARHGYFGHENWEKFAPGLKSISDATTIRRNILSAFELAELEQEPKIRKALLTFVVIGGGPTGVEMAGAIAELSRKALASDFRHIHPDEASVILIEAGSRILASFSESLSQKASLALEKLGVEVRVNTRVDGLDENSVSFGAQRLAARTVVWAAGVLASPAGKWLKAKTDKAGRVLVNPDLSLPDYPNVFAIGDTSTLLQNGKSLPGVSAVAIQEGSFVSRVIKERIEGAKEDRVFRYRDKGSMATVGRSFAIVQMGQFQLSGFMAWLAWLCVHIYYLIGFRNRLMVFIQWAWAYLTFQRGARLIITADKDVPPE